MARKPIEWCLPLVLLLAPGAAAAQAPGTDTALVYRREVFQYTAASRPDPFRPLLGGEDLGVRIDALRLTAVLYDPNQNRSVAIFSRADMPGSLRLRVGQRLGNITVLRILPRRVDVRIDELGVSRVESLTVRRAAFDAAAPGVDAAGAPPSAAGAAPSAAPAAQAPAPPAPLGRGGRTRPTPPATAPAPRPTRPNNP